MDDFTYAGTPAITMFVLFMSLVVIVLMNLLIAIMGDSYDRVRENQFVASMSLRADTLEEIDRQYGWLLKRLPVIKDVCFPKVIRVLAPTGKWEGSGAGDEWEGRLKALRREIEKLKGEVSGNIE